MARTIQGIFIIALALLALAPQAFAIDTISVTQGEVIRVIVDARIPGQANANELTVSVPAIQYLRNLRMTNNDQPTLSDTFIVNQPGTYLMNVRVGRSGQTLSMDQYVLRVLPPGAQEPVRNTVTLAPTPVPQSPGVSADTLRGFRVAPIPDKLAGESFVLPLIIENAGTYVIEIPRLGFAHYEVPNPATVSDGESVPVLIRLHDNIPPGTYLIPITVDGQTTTARIRVIEYKTFGVHWLVPLGLALIIIALVIILLWVVPNKRAPYQPPRPPAKPDNDDEKLITYY